MTTTDRTPQPDGTAGDPTGATGQTVTVHYWAAARAATGTAADELPVTGEVTLAEVLRRVREAHPDERAARVVGTCSVLVGDRPVSTDDPAGVVVRPGETVELLPPFAGG